MIWPLQAIIGYGTKGTIYCPSLCSCLTPSPALCCLYNRKTLLAPCLPLLPIPHFLFPFLWAFPWRGPVLLLSLYLESEASGKQALPPPLSITLNHPDVYSALRPFHRPCTSLCPAYLPLHATMSQLLTTASLITVLHLSISIHSNHPVVFFSTILSLLDTFSSYISCLPSSVFVLEDAVPFVLGGGKPVHPPL